MSPSLDRRHFMGYFAGVGLGSTLFPGVLWAKLAAGEEITVDTIASAEEVAGIHFDPAEREKKKPSQIIVSDRKVRIDLNRPAEPLAAAPGGRNNHRVHHT